MRTTSIIFKTITVAIASVAIALGANAQAQPASLEEAVNTPTYNDKKDKIHQSLSNYQAQQVNELVKDDEFKKNKLKVELVRRGEVIKVSIPAEVLFDPNATSLKRGSEDTDKILNFFKRFLRNNDLLKVVIAMHHDNTGSESYCKRITDERLESIYNWFDNNATTTRNLQQFSCGSDNPERPNTSINNRRLNRRLEIYIVPGNTMIEHAKDNKLH